jgi:cell wall-associated NlpC family hydrolase
MKRLFVSNDRRHVRVSLRIAAAAILALSAARTGAAQTPDDKPFAALSLSAQTLRDSVVALARAQIGTPYKRGGITPGRGFDCSGLVQYVLHALSFDVPRTARLQARTGLEIPRDTSRLLPGDLLTFAKTKKSTVSHVGIYVGDGMFVHASSVAGRVVESKVERPVSPLIKAWRGARRVVHNDADSVVAPVVAPKER